MVLYIALWLSIAMVAPPRNGNSFPINSAYDWSVGITIDGQPHIHIDFCGHMDSYLFVTICMQELLSLPFEHLLPICCNFMVLNPHCQERSTTTSHFCSRSAEQHMRCRDSNQQIGRCRHAPGSNLSTISERLVAPISSLETTENPEKEERQWLRSIK